MVRPGAVVRCLVVCGLALTTLAFAKTNKTIVTYPTFGVSQPVADMPVEFSMFPFREMPEPRPNPNHAQQGPYQIEDPVWQKQAGRNLDIAIGVNFDGIGSPGYAPSDSNMAVGPSDIVEVVNVDFQVFNKTGGTIAGPTSIFNLFSSLPGDCSANTDGDPVVLYDRAADRWVLSMIGVGNTFSECIAVSKTNDPTGAYYLYGYSFGGNLNDYPKLGTWATASNSAYLSTYDIFIGGASFGGSDLCGLDRTKLLAGNSTAAQLCQMTPSSEFSYLPSDMDGPTAPVDGTPGLFIHPQKPNQLFLRTLTLNFPAGTATMSPATVITVPSFTEACHSTCVPQAGTTQKLDALGDLTMYRFPVRHFADHDRALVNDSVIVTGTQVGVRWYELYDPAGAVALNQSGTYAPDSTSRWMASAAEDKVGDIAIGYSASSTSIHPANRMAGRVPTDAAGTLESEISIIEGAGSQSTGLSRWGDYSALQVDPSDDCTFWYVAQYEAVSGTFNWHTRIASWSFPGCSGGGGGPAVSLAPTSLKWGKILTGTTATGKKKVILTNTGNASLNISTIAATGDFALVPVKQTKKVTPCVNGSVIAAGATCEIKVSFTPTQTGARTGSVNFTDNASGSPQSVSLTGTGK